MSTDDDRINLGCGSSDALAGLNRGPANGRRRRAAVYVRADSIVLNQRRCVCANCVAVFAEKAHVERTLRLQGTDPWKCDLIPITFPVAPRRDQDLN